MLRSFWFDQSKWPRDPEGYVFFGRAVHEVGRFLFPAEWTGREPGTTAERPLQETLPSGWSDRRRGYDLLKLHRKDVELEPMPKSVPRFGIIGNVPLNATQWSEARKISQRLWDEARPKLARFMEVQQAIVAACASGKLTCAYRAIAGGELRAIPAMWWNTERNYVRFQHCQVNPRDPFSIAFAGDGFCWMFVNRESLDRFMKKPAPPPPSAAGVHLSPYLQLMLTVARDLDIRTENQPKKIQVTAALNDKWPEGVPKSTKLVEAMATLLREPESQLGKANKAAKKGRPGGSHRS